MKMVPAGILFRGLALGLCCLGSAWAHPPLQEQIDAAAPGAILELEAGVYAGPLVLSQPLTLIGKPGAEIHGSGRGSVVRVTGRGVTLRGFRITGSGTDLSKDDAGIHITGSEATISENRLDDVLHGIYLKKVHGARILQNRIRGKTTLVPAETPAGTDIVVDPAENCEVGLNVNVRGNGIHLWNSEKNLLEDNDIADTRDGMYFSFTRGTTVRRNTVRRVRYGLHYMYSDNNRFEENVFAENAAGAAIMYSKNLLVRGNHFAANHGSRAYGMLLNSVDMTRFENNAIQGNSVGISMQNSNGNVLTGNTIAKNYIGIRLTASSSENAFSRNHFSGNLHPVELAGQSESNRWEIGGIGNRWQGVRVIDLDGNGIGDLPHRESDLLGGLRRSFPLVGLLSGSPGLAILRFARGHAPLPDRRAIKDPAPLGIGVPRP